MAAVAPAGDDHRELGFETDAGFGDCGLRADRLPGLLGDIARVDPRLALAVIAIAPGLEHDRHAELGGGASDVSQGRHRAPRRNTRAALFEKLLLARPVL